MDIVCACRVLWSRRQWTILCQCSQQIWWVPWHNRWIIFRWAPQERWVEAFVLFSWISSIRCKTLFSLALSVKLVLYHWLTHLSGSRMNRQHSACIFNSGINLLTGTRPKLLLCRIWIWVTSYSYNTRHQVQCLFLEKCLDACTCKSRPCNLIHSSLCFFPPDAYHFS